MSFEEFETRQQFLETEVGLLKDTVWRLTGRVFVLENFIKKQFGEVLKASVLYSQIGKLFESSERIPGTLRHKQCVTKITSKRQNANAKNEDQVPLKTRKKVADREKSQRLSCCTVKNYDDCDTDESVNGGAYDDYVSSDPNSTLIQPKTEVVEEVYMDYNEDIINVLENEHNVTTNENISVDRIRHRKPKASSSLNDISVKRSRGKNSIGLPSASKAKSSQVWEYFDLTENNLKSKCKLCGQVVTRGKENRSCTTTAMRNHLKGKHTKEFGIMISIELEKKQAAIANQTSPSTSVVVNQSADS